MVPDLIIQVTVIALVLILTVTAVCRMVKNYHIIEADYDEAVEDSTDKSEGSATEGVSK